MKTMAAVVCSGRVIGAADGGPGPVWIADAMLDDGGTLRRREARLSTASRYARAAREAEARGDVWTRAGDVAGVPVYVPVPR